MKQFSKAVVWSVCMTSIVWGQFDSGSDGSDGPFIVGAGQEVVIDLANAVDADWTTPSPSPGSGVYDADQWAVVFKYATIVIGANATVRFVNHPKGAPVVWLSQNNVVISGRVVLDGEDGTVAMGDAYAEPGPGGFAGGVGVVFPGVSASGGFGPGGGGVGDGGGYGGGGGGGNGGDTYGQQEIVPLIGGSGGGGRTNANFGGGAGGGGILIASSGSVTINASGEISARGGNAAQESGDIGSGSGGSVRILANSIGGEGAINATGATIADNGGNGRVRLEAPEIVYTGSTTPSATVSLAPGPVFAEMTPQLQIVSVVNEGGMPFAVPQDPDARVTTTDAVVDGGTTFTVNIAARFVPPGTDVLVLVTRANGTPSRFTSAPLVGTFESSSTTADVTLMPGRAELQLRANWTP